MLHALAALPLLIWLYLLFARAAFWRVNAALSLLLPPAASHEARLNVIAVIPARDEAAVIGATVRSLLRQQFSGSLHIIVVDDASADGTAEIARQAAAQLNALDRLTVLHAAPLAPGWTGKLWAVNQGVTAAMQEHPDYVLLTDADIHHDAANLAALVATAQDHRCDLVSAMVELSVTTPAEKSLIPAFVFFFFMLYPPRAVASARSSVAAAAGGCMLVQSQALIRIGGMQRIRSELIDDCALARAIKSTGGAIRMGLTRTARSTRQYGSFGEVGRMISRSAFYQLRHSWVLLLLTILGLGITYLLPPLLLLTGDPLAMTLGAAAWIAMAISYAPMVRFYRRSPLWSLCLPAVALFYQLATVHSALQYLLRRGGQWKGRVQDVRT
jgi:hopene-associated glycosyltransferase HpnB